MSRLPDRPVRLTTIGTSLTTVGRASAQAAPDRLRLGDEYGHGLVRVRPLCGAGKRAQHPVEAKAVQLRQHLVGPRDREAESVSPLCVGFAESFDRGKVVDL